MSNDKPQASVKSEVLPYIAQTSSAAVTTILPNFARRLFRNRPVLIGAQALITFVMIARAFFAVLSPVVSVIPNPFSNGPALVPASLFWIVADVIIAVVSVVTFSSVVKKSGLGRQWTMIQGVVLLMNALLLSLKLGGNIYETAGATLCWALLSILLSLALTKKSLVTHNEFYGHH